MDFAYSKESYTLVKRKLLFSNVNGSNANLRSICMLLTGFKESMSLIH